MTIRSHALQSHHPSDLPLPLHRLPATITDELRFGDLAHTGGLACAIGTGDAGHYHDAEILADRSRPLKAALKTSQSLVGTPRP